MENHSASLKSRRWQGPTDLESGIFTEFFLIPLSDYLMVVVHFAIETRCLNIIGGRNGHNPILEHPDPLKMTQNDYLASWRCLVIKFVTKLCKHDKLDVPRWNIPNFCKNGHYRGSYGAIWGPKIDPRGLIRKGAFGDVTRCYEKIFWAWDPQLLVFWW